MHLALLGLETLDVASFPVKMLILLIFELLKFEFVAFPLTILNCFADTLVTAGKRELLSLELLVKLSLEVGHPLLGIGAYLLHLFLLLDGQSVLEGAQLRVGLVLGLRPNLLLLLPLHLLPLLPLLLDVLLVLNH